MDAQCNNCKQFYASSVGHVCPKPEGNKDEEIKELRRRIEELERKK